MASSTTDLPDQAESVKERHLDHESGLYRHTKRPEWGVAILAWERGPRRGYQFEDGRLRTFREGYYSLMKPADEVRGSREAVVSDLEDAIEANRGEDAPRVLEPVCSFDEQMDLFKHLYEGGFQDPQWIADHRRDPDGRELKRHREPVVEAAREQLSKERCDRLVSEDRHDELMASVTEILGNTSLVALKQVKALRRLEEEEQREMAEAIRTLLHGEEAGYGRRFKEYLATMRKVLGGRPSWRLATALPALMYPQDHVCVRRSAFKRQAASIAPFTKYTKKPRPSSYKNYRRVAHAVRTRLEGAGHEPRDLLDIHDFIWATLRNAALEHLRT